MQTPPVLQPPLLLLVGISAIGPIAMNGVLPATTTVMRELSTTYGTAQLVLTVYLVATMVSQIVLGALADRFGRRPVMIGSLALFGVGGIACALAPTIEWLLFGRFLQGFGSAVCVFLTRAIMRDVHARDKAASAIGYMNTAMMIGPMFGPALCGWITDVSSWRFMYMLLAIGGFALSFLSYRYQNETLSPRNETQHSLLSGSRELLLNAEYRAYLAIYSGSIGAYFCFLAGAPYVVMELRGYSASTFGIWFGMVAIGYLLGNLTAGRLSQRLGSRRMILYSLVPTFGGIALFWLFAGNSSLWALFMPMQIIAYSNGVALPNLTSALMSVKPELAGTASGLSGTIQIAVGILLTLAVSFFLDTTETPFFAVITTAGLIALWGLVLWQPWKSPAAVETSSR